MFSGQFKCLVDEIFDGCKSCKYEPRLTVTVRFRVDFGRFGRMLVWQGPQGAWNAILTTTNRIDIPVLDRKTCRQMLIDTRDKMLALRIASEG